MLNFTASMIRCKLNWLYCIFGLFLSEHVHAQCSNPIRTFPYAETFETSNGGFNSSDPNFWKWGTPAPNSRIIIINAASGQKCWTIGGFSGRGYPSGTAYLTSPCFDLGTLTLPEISFKVIWETERNFDGVFLQYSLNEGASWLTLGDDQSNSNCRGINWYNTGSVRYLDNRTFGWSGSQLPGSGGGCNSGGGSGGWLEAKHKLTGLGGSRKVIFRFMFGAGTTCNDYEGFAIDDFSIREGVPAQANGNFSCVGEKKVQFNNIAPFCQRSVSWNFNDPSTGANNTSTLEQPVHIFSGPGTYDVTQTVTFNDNTVSIKQHRVIILDASIQQTGQILCHGETNAVLTAQVSGGTTPYQYAWNNNTNLNGQTLPNLGAGFYFVTITAANACPDSASIRIDQPDPLQLDSSIQNEVCRQSNGSIQLQVQGGVAPYSYVWNNGGSGSSINGIRAGNYTVVVRDGNNCQYISAVMVIQNTDVPADPYLGNDTLICNNETLILNPGNFRSYRWQDNTTRPVFDVQNTGTYYVDVTNTSGCKGSDTIKVTVDCKGLFIPNAFSPNGDGLNDQFGPIGDLALLRNYSLRVFNRFGEEIFSSTDPNKRWAGKYKGSTLESGVYVWQMRYRLNGAAETLKKGTILLIR